ncbi:16950_t:CDS:2 [Racocetra fulgida]|uniref:2-isopropylmalate synthase n=1 Tax=Racocetra fulgida TaxID=60492 RepID=A0A9N9F1Q4_9GLOM|nr:16950_t:CDS:2 [Racocetra fulgida]
METILNPNEETKETQIAWKQLDQYSSMTYKEQQEMDGPEATNLSQQMSMRTRGQHYRVRGGFGGRRPQRGFSDFGRSQTLDVNDDNRNSGPIPYLQYNVPSVFGIKKEQEKYMSRLGKSNSLLYQYWIGKRNARESKGIKRKDFDGQLPLIEPKIARHLSNLGVDVIEAGFPIASQGDFDAVARIAKEVGPLMHGREKIGKPMIIAGLSRATQKDIKRCYEAVSLAPLHRIHTFLATSDIHLNYKLKIDRNECIKRAASAVAYAKSLCDDVEFSSEDSGRTDKDFLCQVLGKVIEAGATTLNIPDTVGYTSPEDYGALIKYLIENTPGTNTLSGITNGARQVEVTINGIGERAGNVTANYSRVFIHSNTSLEEVVMNIHTHPSSYPVYHTINTQLIYRTSTLVSSLSGMVVQPNKAIVGANAFLHESGIHQDGVLKKKETYEIMRPEDVGIFSTNLVLGKLSGRNAFRSRLEQLGYFDMNEDDLNKAFDRFKALADAKKHVTDHDLLALIADHVSSGSESKFDLQSIQVVSGTREMVTATVKLKDSSQEQELIGAAVGRNGPIMAVFSAIQQLVQRKIRLLDYEVRSVSEGMDALGKVVVKITEDVDYSISETDSNPQEHIIDRAVKPIVDSKGETKLSKSTYHGHGTDVDIVMASAKAYVNAINRLFASELSGISRSSLEERQANI